MGGTSPAMTGFERPAVIGRDPGGPISLPPDPGYADVRMPRGGSMKLHNYPETDSLYIELKETPGAGAREIVAGLVVDLDANGEVVGFDIDHASQKLDLAKVETIALPPVTAAG
jgi:uncharacterized protein YuzE